MTSPDKLLPCPFCGGTDLAAFDNAVVCRTCSASGPDLGHCSGQKCREEAVKVWNSRDPAVLAALPEVQALVNAAYERAAYEVAELFLHSAEERGWRDGAQQAARIAKRIRAMKGTKE